MSGLRLSTESLMFYQRSKNASQQSRKKDLVTYVDNSDDESDDESDEESDASAVETFSRSKGPQKSAGASSSINKPGSNTTQQSSLLQETKNGKAKSNGSKSNKNTVPPVNEDSVPNDGSNITKRRPGRQASKPVENTTNNDSEVTKPKRAYQRRKPADPVPPVAEPNESLKEDELENNTTTTQKKSRGRQPSKPIQIIPKEPSPARTASKGVDKVIPSTSGNNSRKAPSSNVSFTIEEVIQNVVKDDKSSGNKPTKQTSRRSTSKRLEALEEDSENSDKENVSSKRASGIKTAAKKSKEPIIVFMGTDEEDDDDDDDEEDDDEEEESQDSSFEPTNNKTPQDKTNNSSSRSDRKQTNPSSSRDADKESSRPSSSSTSPFPSTHITQRRGNANSPKENKTRYSLPSVNGVRANGKKVTESTNFLGFGKNYSLWDETSEDQSSDDDDALFTDRPLSVTIKTPPKTTSNRVLYESSEDEQHTSRNSKKVPGRVSSDSADEIFDRTPKELVKHKTMGSATKGAPAATPRASVKFQSFNVIYSPGRITSGPGSGPRPSMAIVTTPLKKRDAENVVPASSRRQLKELTTTRTPAQNVTPKTTTPKTTPVVAQPQPTEDPKERPNVDRRRSAKPATIIPKETEEVVDVPKSSARREPQADPKERFITERRRPLKTAANNVIPQEAVETPLNPARREPPVDRSNSERRRSARAATDDVIPQEIEQADLPTPSARQDPKERPNTDRRRPAKGATNAIIHQETEEIVDQPATSTHIELNEETKERSKADRRRPAKTTTNVTVHQQTEEVVGQAHRELHVEPKERPKADRQRAAKTETFIHQETEEVLNQPENSARREPREDLKERLNADRRRPAKGSTNPLITQEEIAVDQPSARQDLRAGILNETGTLPKKTKTGTVDLPRQSTPQQTRTPFKEANNVVHPQRTPLRSTSTPTVHPATPLSSHTTEPIGKENRTLNHVSLKRKSAESPLEIASKRPKIPLNSFYSADNQENQGAGVGGFERTQPPINRTIGTMHHGTVHPTNDFQYDLNVASEYIPVRVQLVGANNSVKVTWIHFEPKTNFPLRFSSPTVVTVVGDGNLILKTPNAQNILLDWSGNTKLDTDVLYHVYNSSEVRTILQISAFPDPRMV